MLLEFKDKPTGYLKPLSDANTRRFIDEVTHFFKITLSFQHAADERIRLEELRQKVNYV